MGGGLQAQESVACRKEVFLTYTFNLYQLQECCSLAVIC